MSTPAIDWDALACSEEEWQELCHLTDQHAPRVLPPRWRLVRCSKGRPYAYQTAGLGSLSVLVSAGRREDGKVWLHVSATGRGRIPTYDELCEIKDLFVGAERQALFVFAPRSKHVNIHPHCLHLWACLSDEGDGLPDFGKAGTI